MKSNIYLYIKITLFCVCFLAPTHWFWHWEPSWVYWSGIRMEPWIPKVFISSIFVIFLWILSLFASFWRISTSGRHAEALHFRPFDEQSQREVGILLLGALALATYSSLVSVVPLASLSFWLQSLSGPIALAIWVWWQRSNLPWRWIVCGVMVGVGFQVFLAWWQWFFQAELGGYWLLGQPAFESLGLAKSQASGPTTTLPYGSTPHPNILGAWVVLGIFVWHHLWKQQLLVLCVGVCLLLFTLFLTESLAAWLVLGLGVGVSLSRNWRGWQKKITSWVVVFSLVVVPFGLLLLHLPGESSSLSRRQVMLRSVPHQVLDRPLGWGALQHQLGYTPGEKSRLGRLSNQPVHAAAIALGLDLGIWVFLLLCIFYYFVQIKYSYFNATFITLLPFLYLDHWIYSTISGQYYGLIFLIFFTFINNINRPRTNSLSL